ncbi:TPA: hypothetical protein I7721_02920 [Vibrio vulnificus]|nr:hypothetical protein [Vibrio vulnificus]
MSGGYSFTMTQGVCDMKKTKTGYLLLYLISVVLQAASQASYVLDMSGGRVNTSNPILSGILTVQRVT